LGYACPTIKKYPQWTDYAGFTVLTIRSSGVLRQWPEVAKDVCYLSESVNYPKMLEGYDAEFGKTVSFVLSRSMLESQHKNLKASLEELLLTISKETELIQQDNLARGELVHSVNVSASLQKEKERTWWQWYYQRLQTPVAENDSPEYWGNLNFYGWEDFVAATDKYPWMPESVSTSETPY
jgi:hypothetical protein